MADLFYFISFEHQICLVDMHLPPINSEQIFAAMFNCEKVSPNTSSKGWKK